jgi:hypothetical protein
MYYPDKPNINETVTQIIRAFVEEYYKHDVEQAGPKVVMEEKS